MNDGNVFNAIFKDSQHYGCHEAFDKVELLSDSPLIRPLPNLYKRRGRNTFPLFVQVGIFIVSSFKAF